MKDAETGSQEDEETRLERLLLFTFRIMNIVLPLLLLIDLIVSDVLTRR